MSELARGLVVCACAIVGLSFSTTQSSAVVPVGTVIGVFSDPVYSGYFSHGATPAEQIFYNNSATAPSTTIISRGSTLQWGANLGLPVGTPYSMLTFTGNAYAPLFDQTSPVTLGTISFTNGTSTADSAIFGVTLTFYLGGVMLGSDHVIINTTWNQYGGRGLYLTAAQAQFDADYVNICGNTSNVCNTGIQAYENIEGSGGVAFSQPVVAELDGTYKIGPGIDLTQVSYQSGDGVVAYSPPIAVPEPSTWVMMLAGANSDSIRPPIPI